jgi:predicted DNA-binding protein
MHSADSCSHTVYPTVTLSGMKDSGLRIRVERELREKFLALCREQDKPAAQVIREFMRRYIAENDDEQATPAHAKKKKPA